MNVPKVDGIGREDRDFLSAYQSTPDCPRDLLGPVDVGIRELLPRNVTSRLVPALDLKILGDDSRAEFLVEWSSVKTLYFWGNFFARLFGMQYLDSRWLQIVAIFGLKKNFMDMKNVVVIPLHAIHEHCIIYGLS